MLVGGFGNWSSQKDSIIRGHRKGQVVALKRELNLISSLITGVPFLKIPL